MNGSLFQSCVVCGSNNNLQRCSRCHIAYYCSRDHQKLDWKRHKIECLPINKVNTYIDQGSSETEILSSRIEALKPTKNQNYQEISSTNSNNTLPCTSDRVSNKNIVKDFTEISLGSESAEIRDMFNDQVYHEHICKNVIRDMNDYGVCVVDNFLGRKRGLAILEEVRGLYRTGVFQVRVIEIFGQCYICMVH